MRLFVGVPLADEVIEELSAVSMRLHSSEDGLRWSAPESWHITLQFLGNTSEYECIVARLGELSLPPTKIQHPFAPFLHDFVCLLQGFVERLACRIPSG